MSSPPQVLSQRLGTLGPAVAGRLAKSAGTAAVARDLGALTVLACPPLMWLFERIVSVRNRRAKS
jgi:hypothetical protein